MKNNRKSFFLKYIFTVLIALACIQNAGSTNSTIYESNNSSGQPFNSSTSDEKMWGNSESTMFNNTDNSGSRQSAPPTTPLYEPGETCVPVPDGFWIMLGFLLLYFALKINSSNQIKNKFKLFWNNIFGL